jgi:hypothetical protein
MKTAPRPGLFLVGVFCALMARVAPAADTPAPEISPPNTNAVSAGEMQRAFAQLQEQIHAAQVAIERVQLDAQAASRQNAEDLAARFQLFEKSLNTQRASEFEAMQRTNRLTLLVAGIIAAVVFITMLFTAYFQWRVAARLAELSSVRPTLLTLANSRALSELEAGRQAASSQAVEQANARLLGAVEQLRRRILELEQIARVPPKEEAKPAAAHPVER